LGGSYGGDEEDAQATWTVSRSPWCAGDEPGCGAERRKETTMNVVRDFLGNEITHGASVVYAAKHAGTPVLRKGTVISVSPRLRVRVTLEGKTRITWVRDPPRVVVIR